MARNRRETRLIVVHCAATPPTMDIGVIEINRWHEKRGIHSARGPTGYHFVIRRDGRIEVGRELREVGAPAIGYNAVSVGICLVGGVDTEGQPSDNFTAEQFRLLRALLDVLYSLYPNAEAIPHNLVAAKACPSFDLFAWLENEDSIAAEELHLEATAIIDEIDNAREAAQQGE